jgi:Zn-dependent protease with chaperone function
MTTENLPARRGYIRFPDISSRAYEHPADRGALVALRAIPGFDSVLKTLSGAIGERSIRWLYLATAIRVSPRQYPEIHQTLNECATTLDVEPVPELYIEQDPIPQAMAIGLDKPIIVITTGMLELVDDEGLRFIVGHEVGHVLSGHAVYRTMLVALINLAAAMEWLPIGAWSIRTIILALNEWFRKSELSCDRAGLLCSQDPAAALRVHASLAGARNPKDMDVAGFLDQAEEYETRGDVRDSVLKLLQLSGKSHPLAALRAAELQKWAAGPDYAEILAGNYPRRSDDKEAPMNEEVKAAANSYKQSFTTSADPLYKLVSKIGAAAGTAGGSAANRVRDWWRTGPDRGGDDGGS